MDAGEDGRPPAGGGMSQPANTQPKIEAWEYMVVLRDQLLDSIKKHKMITKEERYFYQVVCDAKTGVPVFYLLIDPANLITVMMKGEDLGTLSYSWRDEHYGAARSEQQQKMVAGLLGGA